MVDSSTSAEKFLCSSSRANTAPASGAPNAAERPAPAPHVISILSSVSRRWPARAKPLPTIEPSWMLGPSRPSASPPPIASAHPAIFAGITLYQHMSFCPLSSASTCGMPEPAISGSTPSSMLMITASATSSSATATAAPVPCAANPATLSRMVSAPISISLNTAMRAPVIRPIRTPSTTSSYLKLSLLRILDTADPSLIPITL